MPSPGAETGFLDRTLQVGGETRRYQVYVPTGYPGGKAWPVILFLHGAGERGRDGLRQTVAGLGPALRWNWERYPALVVFPQAPPGTQWAGAEAELAMAALARTLLEFRTDPERVYLTGLSMGGHGTWYLAYRYPGRFAAIAPVCGWVQGNPGSEFTVPAVPPGDGPPLQALVGRLGRMPVWIFHGDADPIVPVACSREPATALEAAAAMVHYTELPGVGHNAWDAAYGSEAFATWLLAQRRSDP